MSFDQMMTEFGNSVVLTTTVNNQMQAITGDSQFTVKFIASSSSSSKLNTHGIYVDNRNQCH